MAARTLGQKKQQQSRVFFDVIFHVYTHVDNRERATVQTVETGVLFDTLFETLAEAEAKTLISSINKVATITSQDNNLNFPPTAFSSFYLPESKP